MTTMTLSAAIRLGAMLKPQQAFFTLYDPKYESSCALGAAGDAIGLLDTTRYNQFIEGVKAPQTWRWIRDGIHSCPGCRDKNIAEELIIHLNNVHEWTRERIADWVETVEPQPAVVPVAAEVTSLVES